MTPRSIDDSSTEKRSPSGQLRQSCEGEEPSNPYTEVVNSERIIRDPLVSVVMMTYNHEAYIAQAIEGVVSQQTRFAMELIIGEDFSTDRTREIVLDFQRRHPGIIRVFLSDKNSGADVNFRRTMLAARGKYVAFCEGDDYWTSCDKIETQVAFLEAHPDRAICCHRVQVIHETALRGPYDPGEVFPARAAGLYAIEDLLKENFIMTCSMVLRRELIGPFPDWFFSFRLGDWPLCALVARHGKIELMHEVMAAYRLHPGGTWSSLPHVQRLAETMQMLTALDKELEYRYTNIIRRTIAAMYLALALTARSEGRIADTVRYLWNWIRNGGLRAPKSLREFAEFVAQLLTGSERKTFSRAKSTNVI